MDLDQISFKGMHCPKSLLFMFKMRDIREMTSFNNQWEVETQIGLFSFSGSI